MKILGNQLTDVAVTLGDALLPSILDVVEATEPLLKGVGFLAQGFGALPGFIREPIVLFGGGLLALVGPVTAAFGAIKIGLAEQQLRSLCRRAPSRRRQQPRLEASQSTVSTQPRRRTQQPPRQTPQPNLLTLLLLKPAQRLQGVPLLFLDAGLVRLLERSLVVRQREPLPALLVSSRPPGLAAKEAADDVRDFEA